MKVFQGLARCSHCRRILPVADLDKETGRCRPALDCAAHRMIAQLHAKGHKRDLAFARRIERELHRLEGIANELVERENESGEGEASEVELELGLDPESGSSPWKEEEGGFDTVTRAFSERERPSLPRLPLNHASWVTYPTAKAGGLHLADP